MIYGLFGFIICIIASIISSNIKCVDKKNTFKYIDLICTVKRPFIMLSDLNKYYNNPGIQIKNSNNNKKKLKNKNKNNNSNNNNNFNNEKNPFKNNLKCSICGMNVKVSYNSINTLLNNNNNNN
jgi:vacuolar-type H+-ATPase catalytic subunit A/Vma1